MSAPAGWTPSAARTITVSPPSAPLRGIRVAEVPLQWPSKAPVEQLDYSLNLTDWLADATDTALTLAASVSPSASPQDLSVSWGTLIGTGATFMLTGGRSGIPYVVAVQIITGSGRLALFDVQLAITLDPPAPPVPPGSPPAFPVTTSVPGSLIVAGGTLGLGGAVTLSADAFGNLVLTGSTLPLVDPLVAGQLWNNGGVLAISAGPSS